MVTHHRPFNMSPVAGGGSGRNAGGSLSTADTTFTKIFVGGLAWETQKETMCRYFDQFGEILEAVVITDKHTGRSKGYGFVTFTDPEAAARACLDLSPVIDGRRANCNLASLGATHKPRPSASQFGNGQFLTPAAGHAMTASSAYRGSHTSPVSTAYFHQHVPYALPYSLYGGGYSQDSVYPMCYYGLTGGQQQQQQHHHFSPFYPATSPGVFPNFYPYYTPYSHSCQSQEGFGLHYPQILQYSYPPLGSSSGILSLPTTISANAAVIAASGSSKPPGSTQEQRAMTSFYLICSDRNFLLV